MVPLLSGPIPADIFSAEQPMRYMMDKARTKHPNYRVLEGASSVAVSVFGWESGQMPLLCTLDMFFHFVYSVLPIWRVL